MKKLLYVILLSVLLPLSLFSQNKWQSYRNQYGFWNKYQQKWEWESINYSNIDIYFGKTAIWMNDKSQSRYNVIEAEGETTGRTSDAQVAYKQYSWRTRDEKNRICRVSIVYYDDEEYDLLVTVMYDDACFRYYCLKNLSKF